MSYSEVTNRIDEIGLAATFDEIYNAVKSSREAFRVAEEAFKKAKSDYDYDVAQSQHLVNRCVSTNQAEKLEDGFVAVRKVVGNEIVCFKSNGNEYKIQYDTIHL